ncbi:hypothetical protein A374_11900 [Fictibacillus macauensis ZFHKF-1]|uniref:Small basic protein n=1 Tax=Fictibacillus macauensis ZFHKF-1 TaxID=1196324 RepID=I8UDN3_9BACL|nr:small basic family protein [Fictibacillus macauensis]EIT85000.1 hypothetical protein A374_11900 [Fictibacillus macauensis ZFHKF-1]
MWLAALSLIVGLVLGFLSEIRIPPEYSNYLSIAVLAALDTIVGGVKAHVKGDFDDKVFITGFFFNIVLAAGLAFLGVYLGIDLYLAAIFAFGVRLFNNIAVIRRLVISKWDNARKNS